jgi:hypothetical protein
MPATSVLHELQEELRAIPLPDGIHWLDNAPSCVIGRATGGVPLAQFVSWLVHIIPPTGPDGQGAKLFAKRITFPIWLGRPHRDADSKAALQDLVTRTAADFQADLAAGRATEVHDLDLLP